MRAVFLDRDGVLNRAVIRDGKPHPPRSLEEVVIPNDAAAALDSLRRHGYRLIIATNQPDIARKLTSREMVERINRYICDALPIDAVEMCTHDDSDNCDCRKPRPGMLRRAAARDGIDLSQSFMVGDRWRDVEAGRSAGCRTVLIGNGYGAMTAPPDVAVKNLADAAAWIVAQSLGRCRP